MTWAQPGWLWGLLGVAVLALLTVFTARRARARLAGAFGDVFAERLLPRTVRVRRALRDALVALGLAGVVVALAEPRFGKSLRTIEGEGVDLVIAVDLSRSMDAEDVDPSRLERARREILDLLAVLGEDRVGLVIFAGGAWPRLPLTLDRGVLRQVVRELDTHTFQAQGSNVAAALRQAKDLLEGQRGEAGQAVLLLSDGEVHDPAEATKAARELADAGIPVFTLLVGASAAPIPNDDGSRLVDPATGNPVVTTPDPTHLTAIAEITRGAAARSVPGDEDVTALYARGIRPALRAARNSQVQRETWSSAFQVPLGLGLAALLGAAWLGDGRRTLPLALAALLAVGLAEPAHAEEAPTVRDGDLAYRRGDLPEAVRIFTELAVDSPDDPDVLGRLAAARYRAGDATGAARAWARQAEITGDADARFNEGNAWWDAGHLDRAEQRYRDALAAEPGHEGATKNLPLLEAERERRRQQKPPERMEQPGSSGGDPGKSGEEQGEGNQTGTPQGKAAGGGERDDPRPGEQAPGGRPGEERPPEEGGGGGTPGDSPAPPTPGSEAAPGREGTRREQGDADPTGALPDEQGGSPPGEEDAAAGGPGKAGTPSGMTAEQAGRVLDGVEEGTPRVYLPGTPSEKPW